MGRRPAEKEQEVAEIGQDVLRSVEDVEAAFAVVGYRNPALEALAKLALVEYKQADRAIDRAKWFSSLLQVAKVCAGLSDDGDDAEVDIALASERTAGRVVTRDEDHGISTRGAVRQVDFSGWENDA